MITQPLLLILLINQDHTIFLFKYKNIELWQKAIEEELFTIAAEIFQHISKILIEQFEFAAKLF